MREPSSSGAPVSPGASMRAAEALLRARRAEIVAAVVRQAEAGDRTAVRLAREHGLPVEPSPEVLAARLAESIERTRATVAILLAEGGLGVGKDLRLRHALRPGPPDVQVIAVSNVKPGPRAHCSEAKVELVNNNENTSADADGDAASFSEINR